MVLLDVSEKAMASHSSTLAWKIPWLEQPGRLQSLGLQSVVHDWETSVSFSLSCLAEGNGNPSSVLARRIPGTGDPGGLPSMGSHRVIHDWSDLAVAAAAAARCLVHLDCGIMIKNRGVEGWAQRGQWLVDFEVHFRVDWDPHIGTFHCFHLGQFDSPQEFSWLLCKG